MKNFTIYASIQINAEVVKAVEEAFEGFQMSLEGDAIVFNGGAVTVHLMNADDDRKGLDSAVSGIFGYYSQFPFEDEEKRRLVLAQLSVVNYIVGITTKEDFDDAHFNRFGRLTNRLVGIAFLENGVLLDKTGRVIVYPDGKSGDADFNPAAAQRMIHKEQPSSKEGLKRKGETMKRLKKLGIPMLEHLPELPSAEAVRLRSKDEIARRAAALLILIQFACDVAQKNDIVESRRIVREILQRYEVADSLTEKEAAFLNMENPNETDAAQFAWQYEAYWVLAWSLGLVKKLEYPSAICDCNFAMNIILKSGGFDKLMKKAKLRSAKEILDEADFIYRCDWACVSARIKNEAAPAKLDSSVVVERHRAFNWLTCYKDADWDYVTMDT